MNISNNLLSSTLKVNFDSCLALHLGIIAELLFVYQQCKLLRICRLTKLYPLIQSTFCLPSIVKKNIKNKEQMFIPLNNINY